MKSKRQLKYLNTQCFHNVVQKITLQYYIRIIKSCCFEFFIEHNKKRKTIFSTQRFFGNTLKNMLKTYFRGIYAFRYCL